jgi:hypothetical protein
MFEIHHQSAGGIEVKPLVDDETWSIGANFNVGAQGASLYPWFYSANGRYTYVRDVFSKGLNNTRDLVVYVPASFDENPLKIYRYVPIFIFNDFSSLNLMIHASISKSQQRVDHA